MTSVQTIILGYIAGLVFIVIGFVLMIKMASKIEKEKDETE